MYFTETHIYIPTAYFTLQKHTFTYMLPSMHSTETIIHKSLQTALYRKTHRNAHCCLSLYKKTFSHTKRLPTL